MPKLFNLKSNLQKGFTLIEVLVVIGILGILATIALVAINPAEAQKKARDTARLKDLATLQSIVEQYIQDNPGSGNVLIAAGNSKDSSVGGKTCAVNWLGVNLCPYANTIPTDPSNRSTSVTNGAGVSAAANAYYYYRTTASGYKLCAYLESTSNASKVLAINDGGNNDTNFEVFSSQTIGCPQ